MKELCNKDINRLRAKIDLIDKKIVNLLNQRFLKCIELAKIKNSTGRGVVDLNRQHKILNKVKFLSNSKFKYANYLIFFIIIIVSVNLQINLKNDFE